MVADGGAALGIAGKLLGPLLELFQQKAFVFVDVSFGEEKPYRLTVVNQSRYDVHLNELRAEPDGFRMQSTGWDVLKGDLFRNKVLKPGQRICLNFSPQDLGADGKKHFTVRYATLIRGKKVPRYEQSCDFLFDRDTYTVQVSRAFTIPIATRGASDPE